MLLQTAPEYTQLSLMRSRNRNRMIQGAESKKLAHRFWERTSKGFESAHTVALAPRDLSSTPERHLEKSDLEARNGLLKQVPDVTSDQTEFRIVDGDH
jgi:hypothetical protein